MIATFYTMEQMRETYPELIDDEEEYFGTMIWHNNIEWIDFLPDHGATVVTTDDGQLQYVLPATTASVAEAAL